MFLCRSRAERFWGHRKARLCHRVTNHPGAGVFPDFMTFRAGTENVPGRPGGDGCPTGRSRGTRVWGDIHQHKVSQSRTRCALIRAVRGQREALQARTPPPPGLPLIARETEEDGRVFQGGGTARERPGVRGAGSPQEPHRSAGGSPLASELGRRHQAEGQGPCRGIPLGPTREL